MHPEELLERFAAASDVQARVLDSLRGEARRGRTGRPGQYALDVAVDAEIVAPLVDAGLRVLSEESGFSGPAGAAVTVVVDPVDGSTNCAHELPYWCISLCALDQDGPLCAFVRNPVSGDRFSAIRGEGAFVNGARLVPSTSRVIGESMVGVSGLPRPLGWRQFRALGSAALALCDVAAGRLDGYVDAVADGHAPWDYLGGLLVCREAGAVIADAAGRELVTTDPGARRTLVAAGTPELLATLRAGAGS